MKKGLLLYTLAAICVLLSISATFSFAEILKNFSISSGAELAFFIGFVLYLVVHFTFYKPLFIHVMSHELTHILWALLFGGKAKKIEVSDKGGKVLINRSNFLISLAPYFFPLYTFIFVIIYLIARVEFHPYIAFFIGASLSFHLALTLYSMRNDQSDFKEDSNVVFSLIFIYLMNVIVVALVLAVLSDKVDFLPFLKNILVNLVELVKKFFIVVNNLLK